MTVSRRTFQVNVRRLTGIEPSADDARRCWATILVSCANGRRSRAQLARAVRRTIRTGRVEAWA